MIIIEVFPSLSWIGPVSSTFLLNPILSHVLSIYVNICFALVGIVRIMMLPFLSLYPTGVSSKFSFTWTYHNLLLENYMVLILIKLISHFHACGSYWNIYFFGRSSYWNMMVPNLKDGYSLNIDLEIFNLQTFQPNTRRSCKDNNINTSTSHPVYDIFFHMSPSMMMAMLLI